MAAVVAVGLDGREIPPEELAAVDGAVYSDAPQGRFDIEVFDQFPKWARETLREVPKYDVRAHEIAPHIATGNVNPFNIRTILLQNDAAHRAHFKKRDRADGLA